ncbi:MAG: DUF1007 family protein [Candidatus Cloacimonetes bacterium]|nr:DUF1007 family protein [Candidatus Cloacimonadota bacterium]
MLFIAPLNPHPHIWIEYIVEPVFSDTKLERLQHRYTFCYNIF